MVLYMTLKAHTSSQRKAEYLGRMYFVVFITCLHDGKVSEMKEEKLWSLGICNLDCLLLRNIMVHLWDDIGRKGMTLSM